jgi:hypothetical protein
MTPGDVLAVWADESPTDWRDQPRTAIAPSRLVSLAVVDEVWPPSLAHRRPAELRARQLFLAGGEPAKAFGPGLHPGARDSIYALGADATWRRATSHHLGFTLRLGAVLGRLEETAWKPGSRSRTPSSSSPPPAPASPSGARSSPASSSCATAGSPSSSSSATPGRPRPRTEPPPPRASSTRRGPSRTLALLLAVLPVAAPGCCTPAPPAIEVRPTLPPGEPPDRTAELGRRMTAWVDAVGPDGQAGTVDDVGRLAGADGRVGTPDDLTELPGEDLELLLQDRAEWRATAEARKRAGRWAPR